MERKIIISLVSGYLVSMLPIWTIDSRMQEIILTFAVTKRLKTILLKSTKSRSVPVTHYRK